MRIQHHAKVWPSQEWETITMPQWIIHDDSGPALGLVEVAPGCYVSLELFRRNRPRYLRRWARTHRQFWPKRAQRMAGK